MGHMPHTYITMSTLDKQKGLSLVSTYDKSVIGPLVGYCDDLDGCGTNTHIRFRNAGTLNDRTNCAPPFPIFQYSFSGIHKIGTAASVHDALYTKLIAYVEAVATAADPFTAPGTPGFVTGVSYEFRGERWEAKTVSNQVESLVIPLLEEVLDQCGNPVGTKITSGIAFTAPDADCKINIESQLSMTLTINVPPAQISDYLAAANVPVGLSSATEDTNCASPEDLTVAHLARFALPFSWPVIVAQG